jgi:hypothetical protein
VADYLELRQSQPYLLLHELAHAFNDHFSESIQSIISEAYESAKTDGRYESVPYITLDGQKLCHQNALASEFEFFAEMTEAYFGQNDFYPFNREDLKSFDP